MVLELCRAIAAAVLVVMLGQAESVLHSALPLLEIRIELPSAWLLAGSGSMSTRSELDCGCSDGYKG